MKNLLIYKTGATRWYDRIIPSSSTYQEIECSGFQLVEPEEAQAFYIKRTFVPYKLPEKEITIWIER